MTNKKRNWGGKLGGTHTTVIEVAWLFLPDIIKEPVITKISPGFIAAGKSSSSLHTLKIIDDKGCILLSIRGKSAHQELRIFATDMEKAKRAIEHAAKPHFKISFGSRI